jgi:hypothetical protein
VTTPSSSGGVLANNPLGGNSNFLFYAFDESSGKFYLQGLPVRLDDLAAGGSSLASYSLAGLSEAFAGTQAPFWGVVAADYLGSDFEGYRIVSSTPSSNALTAADFTSNNNGFAVNFAANALRVYVNRVDALFPNGPWPLVVTDPTSEANPLDSFGFAFSDTGPLTVNNLLDGGQLFAWLEASSSTEGIEAATFTQLGNWTVSLSSNTLTYSTNTTEFAKLVLWAGRMRRRRPRGLMWRSLRTSARTCRCCSRRRL